MFRVRLFASNLSGLLANDIDISYNICFVRRKEDWTELGIDMMHRPLLMMTEWICETI